MFLAVMVCIALHADPRVKHPLDRVWAVKRRPGAKAPLIWRDRRRAKALRLIPKDRPPTPKYSLRSTPTYPNPRRPITLVKRNKPKEHFDLFWKPSDSTRAEAWSTLENLEATRELSDVVRTCTAIVRRFERDWCDGA